MCLEHLVDIKIFEAQKCKKFQFKAKILANIIQHKLSLKRSQDVGLIDVGLIDATNANENEDVFEATITSLDI